MWEWTFPQLTLQRARATLCHLQSSGARSGMGAWSCNQRQHAADQFVSGLFKLRAQACMSHSVHAPQMAGQLQLDCRSGLCIPSWPLGNGAGPAQDMTVVRTGTCECTHSTGACVTMVSAVPPNSAQLSAAVMLASSGRLPLELFVPWPRFVESDRFSFLDHTVSG